MEVEGGSGDKVHSLNLLMRHFLGTRGALGAGKGTGWRCGGASADERRPLNLQMTNFIGTGGVIGVESGRAWR